MVYIRFQITTFLFITKTVLILQNMALVTLCSSLKSISLRAHVLVVSLLLIEGRTYQVL